MIRPASWGGRQGKHAMWVWILLISVFCWLIFMSNSIATEAGGGWAALLGTVTDGLAMLAMFAGLAGMLMVLVFGVLPHSGARVAGAQLFNMLIWCGALIGLSFLMLALGSYARRLAARAQPRARAAAGGH